MIASNNKSKSNKASVNSKKEKSRNSLHIYQNELPSFRMVQSSRPAASLAYILVILFFATIFVLIFVPWQQTTEGMGRIVAYAPLDRQQAIEAPINGRVVKWHTMEGSKVRKGDPILDISDNDPDFLDRIRQERRALESRLEATKERERNPLNLVLLLYVHHNPMRLLPQEVE
ncbi:biotin/lipoyl-binding protein [Leptospira sp. GIMC2001]|uniref:biotin/lipoyl-binding protein n=1 Tax=Leptospira sp. GIMC2001 TaxID=1513297 RepID=UPI00234A02E9|nr:biotin/lipoyl-binding protein [Leptospira sp. GIMC2001]WCL49598.1 biotin/lipoyl-binding protein [Leptospira sp. GIMC2001]